MPITTTTPHRLTKHAEALVLFAEQDREFANQLLASLRYHFGVCDTLITTRPSVCPELVPSDASWAAARAAWLFQELHTQREENVRAAKNTLLAWARDYPEPQDIVIGIVGLAIIGPTLGIVKKTKRKKKNLRVVLDAALSAESTARQLAIAQEAATALLATELATVGGNAYRLDPETAEWLFTDQETKLHQQDQRALRDTAAWLQAEALPHHALYQDGHLYALAVAPSVHEDVELGECL